MVGQAGSTGGFRVHRYVDRDGRECAYYDTTLLFPTNALSLSGEPTGVAVLDMTDPAKPVQTTTLITPAMQTPHESLNISVERGLLAAVMGNPAFAPGVVDVYDLSRDCRHPELHGQRSGRRLRPRERDGARRQHLLRDLDQHRPDDRGRPEQPAPAAADLAGPVQHRTACRSPTTATARTWPTGDGLVILDLSEVQARKPNPAVREISRLTWSNMTIPQIAIPVTIGGKPYLVEIDEYSSGESGGSVAANGPRVGAARIIDISDERQPFVVSNIRLEVHQPENRAAIAGDPGAQSPVQGYAGHYCNVPQRAEPGIVACSMILSGLRVFDIRDPEHPTEIAYYVAPPSTVSATGTAIVDERANYAMSQPAFAPERGEIWYSDGTSGFYALRMDPAVWPFRTAAAAGSGRCARARRARVWRSSCGLVRRLSLARRVFRGPLVGSYRLRSPARATLAIARGRRVVKRFTRTGAAFRFRVRGLRPGRYTVRLVARSGDELTSAAVSARRRCQQLVARGELDPRPLGAAAGLELVRVDRPPAVGRRPRSRPARRAARRSARGSRSGSGSTPARRSSARQAIVSSASRLLVPRIPVGPRLIQPTA